MFVYTVNRDPYLRPNHSMNGAPIQVHMLSLPHELVRGRQLAAELSIATKLAIAW